MNKVSSQKCLNNPNNAEESPLDKPQTDKLDESLGKYVGSLISQYITAL